MAAKPTICVDFDGVLNEYRGWTTSGDLCQPSPDVDKFLQALSGSGYKIVILTTRPSGMVWIWLMVNRIAHFVDDVTDRKPPAVAYIDDRAIRFDGDYKAVLDQLSNFSAWWEKDTDAKA